MELIALAFMFYAGNTLNDEPHWSLRDGCKAQTVKAANGSYTYDSYDHCKSLPRVYGGVQWKPTQSRSKEA